MERHACRRRLPYAALQSGTIGCRDGDSGDGLWALDGHLRAYSAKDGNIAWDFDALREFKTVNRVPAKGGSIDGPGPAIAGGILR